MDMPFKMYHALYRAAWQESVDKAKQAEEAEKKAIAEEKQAQKKAKTRSSREHLDDIRARNLAGGLDLSGIDMDDLADELGM